MRHCSSLDAEGFDATVSGSPLPVVIDFWAQWCAPCQQMAPVVDQVASEMQGRATFFCLDVDDHPSVARRFTIRSVPTFLVLWDEKVLHRFVGARTKAAFIAELDSAIG